MSWTPAAQPNTPWTAIRAFVFSPRVFSLRPVFASENVAQEWQKEAAPSTTWTQK